MIAVVFGFLTLLIIIGVNWLLKHEARADFVPDATIGGWVAMRKRESLNRWLLATGMALTILGVGTAVYALREPLGLTDIKEWKKTEGLIVATSIEQYKDAAGKDRFTPVLIYQYTVGNTSYTERFVDSAKSRLVTAERALNIFPVGGTLNIYYSEAEPARSTIYPSLTPRTTPSLLFFAAVYGSIAAIIFFSARYEWRVDFVAESASTAPVPPPQ